MDDHHHHDNDFDYDDVFYAGRSVGLFNLEDMPFNSGKFL